MSDIKQETLNKSTVVEIKCINEKIDQISGFRERSAEDGDSEEEKPLFFKKRNTIQKSVSSESCRISDRSSHEHLPFISPMRKGSSMNVQNQVMEIISKNNSHISLEKKGFSLAMADIEAR